jgi:sulfite exporter TauE/SafE
MSSLPKPDEDAAPPDDRNHDRAPMHLAREFDRVFLDRYVVRNLPLKSRRTAVLQIFLFWGFIAFAAALSLNPFVLPRLIGAVHDVGTLVGSLPGWVASWAGVSLAIFLAASISSTVGFAFSAVAAAMILHLVPDNVAAVQIMMAASIGIQAWCVTGLRRTISWRACAPFVAGGVGSMPLGIYLLLTLPMQIYVFLIGVALSLYGAYTLLARPRLIKKGGIRATVAVGALGGLTGPLAAFPGAFVTIWCGMQGWDKVTSAQSISPTSLSFKCSPLQL